MGIGNPFSAISLHVVSSGSWILYFLPLFVETSTAFIMTLICAKLLVFLLLFLIYFQYNQAKQFTKYQLVSINKQQDWVFFPFALIGIVIALPYVYLKGL